MTPKEVTAVATELADALVSLSGGPRTSRTDAINLIATFWREAYERGRDDYHSQLSGNWYPRGAPKS